LSFLKSILFIFFGVCIASVVVSLLTSLKWIGLGIAIIALTYIVINGQIKKKSRNRI